MKIQISSDLTLLGNHGAGYFPGLNRKMVVDSSEPALLQFLNTYHESVHVGTDQAVRTKPNSVRAALAISFEMKKSKDSNASNISRRPHESLPEGYEKFAIDEVKAYRAQGRLLEQIQRKNPDALGFLEEAESSKADSIAFANASLDLIEETKSYLLTDDHFRLMRSIRTDDFAPDAPSLKLVVVTIPRADGSSVVAKIPIKDLTPDQAKGFDSPGLRDRIVAKLNQALTGVRRTLNAEAVER